MINVYIFYWLHALRKPQQCDPAEPLRFLLTDLGKELRLNSEEVPLSELKDDFVLKLLVLDIGTHLDLIMHFILKTSHRTYKKATSMMDRTI